MTLPNKKFEGASFFSSIRAEMDSNQGMALGNDNGLQFVVMDAALYRLEIFLRDDDKTFIETAQNLSPDIRVITNGSHTNSYNKERPTKVKPLRTDWQGEVIDRGSVPRPGDLPSYPLHYFIGRENAIPIWRYHSNRGNPSGYTPKLEYALGRLLPLIQGRKPYCPHPQTTGGTPVWPNCVPSNAMTQYFRFEPEMGKVGVGIHRSSGCVFVFCQEDSFWKYTPLSLSSSGMNIRNLIERMMAMGVDDAVLGDGSDSACLIVDKTIHATPGEKKNFSITTGLMFRLTPLIFNKNESFWITGQSTHPDFQFSDKLDQVEGSIETGGQGLVLRFDSIGILPNSTSLDTATKMEINSYPLMLTSASTDLHKGATFLSSPPKISIKNLHLSKDPGGKDQLTGTIQITTSKGDINGDLFAII